MVTPGADGKAPCSTNDGFGVVTRTPGRLIRLFGNTNLKLEFEPPLVLCVTVSSLDDGSLTVAFSMKLGGNKLLISPLNLIFFKISALSGSVDFKSSGSVAAIAIVVGAAVVVSIVVLGSL